MLMFLFRKCCRILWKTRSHRQHIIWLFLLVLFSQQQGSDAKPRKWNHRIQRRFMWKQMDSSVDGFVDHVVTGARVMKSMIGDFMPPKQSSSNVMDYLPTETTRIRYIIRNPHTKETKVIRLRPSKKVVKLMAMTPKPLLADKPKLMHMDEQEHTTDKLKSMHMKEPEHMTEKLKSMYSIDRHKLRQLEKEQELIAEGRIPMKSESRPSYMSFLSEKPAALRGHKVQFHADDDVISGKIHEFNESWRPVYKLGDPPAGFSTSKPYMMSSLHTSVVGELLPEPQKQVYEPLTSNHFPEEEPKKSHTYEVTEYTAEESIVQPFAHEYLNPRRPSASLSSQTAEAPLKQSPVTTETPNIVTQIEDDSAAKTYLSEYRSQRGFLPSRESFRLTGETSTTTSTPRTTTTTEEPNYPAIYLKKIRNRPDSNYSPKVHQRSKSPEIPLESSWLPSNVTYTSQRSGQIPYHQHLTSINTSLRTNSQKWPPDIEDTYLNSESSATYNVSNTTKTPDLEEFTTSPIINNSSSRKNVRLKETVYSSFAGTNHRSVRHRGSVKFGDKLEIEER